MKILVIEDQENLAKLIKKGLKQEGYAVDYLTDGESGENRIALHNEDYDLVILDLVLPKKGGLEVCKSVRKMQISTPILILTAKDGTESRVTLLDAGADDYLTKPFEFKELLARIRAITRRPKINLPEKLTVADLTLDPATRIVTRAGNEINLTLKEFRVLEYLMRHYDKAVSREDIVCNLWDFDFDSMSNVLDVFVNKIREKVDKEYPRKLIKTVRGIGYKMVSA